MPLDGIVALAEQAVEEAKLITVEEELEQYRTEFSKTYLKSDGTLEAVISSTPIHFKEDGKWVEIDSSLETAENENGEEVLQNKKGSFNVEFPTDYLVSKNVYKIGGKDLQIDYPPNPKDIGDNMVGFMSQIGWTEDNSNSPNKKISMEKIYVDVDADGGNGGETFVWEAIVEWIFGDALLHSKIPHRTRVVEKTIEFLEE